MTVTNASTSRLDAIAEPSADDLAAMEAEVAPVADLTAAEWTALLDAEVGTVTVAPKFDEDFWAEDENVHDDRWDGNGVPSWSAWA